MPWGTQMMTFFASEATLTTGGGASNPLLPFQVHAGYVMFWALLSPCYYWREHGGMFHGPAVDKTSVDKTSVDKTPEPAGKKPQAAESTESTV